MSRQFKQVTDGPERAKQRTSGAAQPVRVALLDGDAAHHASFRSHLTAHAPDWQLDLHTHGEPALRALRAAPPQLVNQWGLTPRKWDAKQEREMGR